MGDGRLGRLVPLETAPHILGLAPPGTGKTRRWLAPSAVLWPGPAVVSSSKDDLMQMVASRRWGKAILLDLRPITPPFYPRDFVACRYDPTMLIRTLEDAQAAAETLLSMSSVGFGGTQARPATDNGMWETLAFAPLTCLLYAASPAGTGLGIEWALEAAEDVTVPLRWPQQVGTEASWATAALWCGHPLFEARVRGILNMVDKRRDSVKMTATVDGQVLHVDLGRSYVLAAVSITPGWVAKTPGGKDEWSQHRVVSRVQYIFNDTDRTCSHPGHRQRPWPGHHTAAP